MKFRLCIERAKLDITRLEELFETNSTLPSATIEKQLLDLIKDCKKLDKLMGTKFFDDEHFEGLVEQVRLSQKYPQMNHQRAIAEQVSRMFSVSSQDAKENQTVTPGVRKNMACKQGKENIGIAPKDTDKVEKAGQALHKL